MQCGTYLAKERHWIWPSFCEPRCHQRQSETPELRRTYVDGGGGRPSGASCVSAACVCAPRSYQFRGGGDCLACIGQALDTLHTQQDLLFRDRSENIWWSWSVIDRCMCVDMRLGTEGNFPYRGILMGHRSVLGAQRLYSACRSEKRRPRQWTAAQPAHAGTDRTTDPWGSQSHKSKLRGLFGGDGLGRFPAMANPQPHSCPLLAGGTAGWSVRGERHHVWV